MQKNTKFLITKLAKKLTRLRQPIHVLAICFGGITIAKEVTSYLNKQGIRAKYYKIWTNVIKGKSALWKSEFKSKDYVGTAVIVDDVIWAGRHVKTVKKLLKKMNPKKKSYVAVLLDCNKKADFSVYN
jgi:hypoxanthine phosphoribosyltransferase